MPQLGVEDIGGDICITPLRWKTLRNSCQPSPAKSVNRYAQTSIYSPRLRTPIPNSLPQWFPGPSKRAGNAECVHRSGSLRLLGVLQMICYGSQAQSWIAPSALHSTEYVLWPAEERICRWCLPPVRTSEHLFQTPHGRWLVSSGSPVDPDDQQKFDWRDMLV